MIAAFRRMSQRALALFRRRTLDTELQAEIDLHLEAAIADNIRSGLNPDEAKRKAYADFGGITQAIEQQRDAQGLPMVDVLRQDLRFTVRTLWRDRALAAVVVLILALGIGANVAVFSVVNTILLRPLPFPNAGRLVWLAGNQGKGGLSEQTYTVAAYEEFRRHNQSFEDVTSYQTFFNSIQYKMVGRGEPVPLTGVQVAENFFPLLGAEPVLGRLFTPNECRKGGPAAALLSYQFWQRQFGGNSAIVGQTITIRATPADIAGPVTIIGVLPASFDFGTVFSPGMKVDFYVPAYMDFWRTWGNTLAVLGRMKAGVSVGQAQAEANTLFPQLKAANKGWFSDYKSKLTALQERVSGKLRQSLIVLWCAVGLILLIVCINVSNLLLARAMSRRKEFAMRMALGATRGRLIRQLLTESVLLSGAGTVLGVVLAWAITSYLARQTQIALPLLPTVRIDTTALVWAAAIATVVAVLFGLAPALRMANGNLHELVKEGGPGMSQRRRSERLRSTLVISEVALACVLLVGSGLLLRSFVRLLDVDLGFQPAQVAAMKIDVEETEARERRGPVLQQILEHVRALPGIETAGMTDMLPLDRNRSWGLVAKENLNDGKPHTAFVYVVSPGYLESMGMRLIRGRDISWSDGANKERAVVINEAAARREWPGQDPLGREAYGMARGPSRIVGVVADVRESSLEEEASAQVYLPITQFEPEGVELVVRTRLPLPAIESAVMAALRQLNPGQPRMQFRPIQQIVDHAVSPRRFLVLLVSSFGAFGLVLASLGIYGVISYSVSRQVQEIGIRMALGASSRQVRFGVVAQTLWLTLIGIGIGGAASFAVTRGIASLLYETAPWDPTVFAAMILILCGVALMAGQIPARRAARIDPMSVLRRL
jgi:predicted permease